MKHHVYNTLGEVDYSLYRPVKESTYEEIIAHIYSNYIKNTLINQDEINILFLGCNSGINDVQPIIKHLNEDDSIENKQIALYCIDDSDNIQTLKHVNVNNNINIILLQADIETYPTDFFMKENYFDFVLSFFVLNHLTNWKYCVYKVDNLLKINAKWFMLHYDNDPYVLALENAQNAQNMSAHPTFEVLQTFHIQREKEFNVNYTNSLLGINIYAFFELISDHFSKIEIKDFKYEEKVNEHIFTEDFYINPKNTPVFWGKNIQIKENSDDVTVDYKNFISSLCQKYFSFYSKSKYSGCLKLSVFEKYCNSSNYEIKILNGAFDNIYNALNSFYDKIDNDTFKTNNLRLLQLFLANQILVRETNFLSPIFWDFEQGEGGIKIDVEKSASFESIISTRNYENTIKTYSTHLNLFTQHDKKKIKEKEELFSVADVIFKTGTNLDWIFLESQNNFECEIIDNHNQKFVIFYLPNKYLRRTYSAKFNMQAVSGFQFNNFLAFNVDEINKSRIEEDDIFDINTINEEFEYRKKLIKQEFDSKNYEIDNSIIDSIANRIPRFIFLTKLGICINFTNSIYQEKKISYGNGSFLLNETFEIQDFIKNIKNPMSFLSQRYLFLKKCLNLYTYLCIRPIFLNKLAASYKLSQKSATNSAIASIMSRNMSHNLGSHVISGTKNYLMNKDYDLSSADNRGMHRLLQYLQERMDFISVIINTSSGGYSFGAPLNLKTDILDEIAADGRDKRHNQGEQKKQTKSFLLDYIIRSEDIIRDDVESKMKLELMLLLEKEKNEVVIHTDKDESDTIIYSFSSEANGDNNANEFNSIEFSVPFGINSRHAFLTIIENYIRNSAKYNKNAVSNKILLISILIKEKDNDTYTITIFDNKEKVNDELFNGKRCLETDIQILKEDDSLNTKNKGIKEMLICSAWLQGQYEDDWSIIESKSKRNQELLNYEQVPLSKITQGIENSIADELDDTRKEEKRKRLAYYNKNDTALGIQFDLPKHKYVYYAKIKNVKDIYSKLPSADFYLIELDEIVNEQKVKYTLPNVILVNVRSDKNIHYIFIMDKDCNQNNKLIKTITVEGNITAGEAINKAINKAINNKSILLECYKFKYNYEDRQILINYLINSSKYRDDIVNVIRTEGKIDNAYLKSDSKVYIFSRHNDTPSIFTKFYEKSKKLYPGHRFLEGISGASYNYNLLINAPIQELEFYKIIHSCDTKIAIIDERIYDKYRKLKFPDNVSNDINITEFNNDIEHIRKLEGRALDLSDDCYNFLYKYVGGDLRKRHERIEEFLQGQKAIDITQSYNRPYTEEKGIYIYNYDFENNCLVNLDGTCLQKINSDVEFLSIHYGILDKYKKSVDKKNILMGDKFNFNIFIKEVVDDDKLSNTRIILHSGRGGVVKIANDVTFVPLSSIESCMDDCKYKLAQLFFNLKYKKETGL